MMKILHDRQDNLRAIWRTIIHVLAGIAVFVPFIPILKILSLDPGETGPASSVNLVFVLLLDISFVLAGWIMLKWVDRRPPALLGLNSWFSSLREISIGFGIGVANFGIVFLVLLSFGWISVEWAGVTIALWSTFFFYLATYLVFAGIEGDYQSRLFISGSVRGSRRFGFGLNLQSYFLSRAYHKSGLFDPCRHLSFYSRAILHCCVSEDAVAPGTHWPAHGLEFHSGACRRNESQRYSSRSQIALN
jgi:hypothetical protein